MVAEDLPDITPATIEVKIVFFVLAVAGMPFEPALQAVAPAL